MKTTKFAKIIALVLTLALLVGSVMTLSVSAEEAAADTTGKILAQSVIYGEKTYIMFAVQAENASDVTVNYTWEGDETVYTASVYDGAEYEGAVIFVTDGVALYELGKKVTASVSVGGAVVDTKTYSVAEFLYRQLYNNGVTGDQKAFYESLLECGANAQKYIAKETENLVTDLTYVYTDNAEVTVNGGKYALVNDGATVTLAYKGAEYEWTVSDSIESPYIVTVDGDSVKVDIYTYDPSYMTQKGEGMYYISDFNNASVMEGVTQEHINPWGSTTAVVGNTVAHGNFTNANGTVSGINIQRAVGNAYGSFNYRFPASFDITNAKTIVIKLDASVPASYVNAYAMLKSGSTYTTLNANYAKFYNGANALVSKTVANSSVYSGFATGYYVIDVEAFIEATGITSIDGVVVGYNHNTVNITIDEMYYTVDHECTDVCETCGKCSNAACFDEACSEKCLSNYVESFTTVNTISGTNPVENSDAGLKMTGAAWATEPVKFTATKTVDLSKVSTITVRFKATAGAVICYFNGSGYENLSDPTGSLVVSKTVDSEGYTVLVYDAAKLAAKFSLSTFESMHFKKNDAGATVYLDYVAFECK